MPVNSITYQPAANQLLAAYRPIVFNVEATDTDGGPVPPFVVCDVYLNDIYYKSILRTSPESFTNLKSLWTFDIQDALQESMQADLPVLLNNTLLNAPDMSAKVFVKFRASVIDADGFTIEEPTKPVQGTKFTAPVSGTGLLSNTFFAINSALQHEDNQNLAIHLNSFKQGTWSADAYPLTHRKNYFFCPGDSDHFPLIFVGDCRAADVVLKYRNKGETIFNSATAEDTSVCTGIGYSVSVTANQVTVTLDSAMAAGQQMQVRYKLQSDSTWITAGIFTPPATTFAFNVNGSDVAGDYDIQLILFCSACQSADPIADTFTLDGSVVNTGWRGISPYCLVNDFETPVYYKLDLRNPTSTDVFLPNDTLKFSRDQQSKKDLYAQFFSDATMLTPVSVTQVGLRVYVKQLNNQFIDPGTGVYLQTQEDLISFTVNAAGTEVLLGNVMIQHQVDNYGPYPTVTSFTQDNYTYSVFPTNQLTSGNTGFTGFATLEEVNTDTNVPTGVTKPNVDTDPDYIAPNEDTIACPAGPHIVTAFYGNLVNVSKVEVRYGAGPTFVYFPPESETLGTSSRFIVYVPSGNTSQVTVKANTLDPANLTGILKVTVSWVAGGVIQSQIFDIPNNIETLLPAMFPELRSIRITNH